MDGIGEETNNNSKDVKIVIPKHVETIKKEHPLWIRIGAALFYVISSTVITMANKVVLTSYQFPSYQAVALGQIGTAIVVLFLARELDLIDFPVLERGTLRRVCLLNDKL